MGALHSPFVFHISSNERCFPRLVGTVNSSCRFFVIIFFIGVPLTEMLPQANKEEASDDQVLFCFPCLEE
jgi:hypothetical protein